MSAAAATGTDLPPADAPSRIVDKAEDRPSGLGAAFHNTGKAVGSMFIGLFDITGAIVVGIGKGIKTLVDPQTYQNNKKKDDNVVDEAKAKAEEVQEPNQE